MALENTKVAREQGGDILVVKSGGKVKIETGGQIVPNSGTQAATIADAAALTENTAAIGGTNDGNLPALVDPSGDAGASVIAGVREVAAGHNALVAKFNTLLAALEGAGILASS
jgi:hypothetical protein